MIRNIGGVETLSIYGGSFNSPVYRGSCGGSRWTARSPQSPPYVGWGAVWGAPLEQAWGVSEQQPIFLWSIFVLYLKLQVLFWLPSLLFSPHTPSFVMYNIDLRKTIWIDHMYIVLYYLITHENLCYPFYYISVMVKFSSKHHTFTKWGGY